MHTNAPDSLNGHLADDDIDLLAWVRQGWPQPETRPADLERLTRHMEACDACRSQVEACEEEMAAMQSALGELRPQPGPECPSEEIWPSVAAGLSPSLEARDHAAECGYCGSLLRRALTAVTADATPEEMEALSKLPSSRPGMPGVIAQRLAADLAAKNRVARPTHAPVSWALRLKWLSLAATVTVAIGVIVWIRAQHTVDPEIQLASLYSSHRTMEWRFPGAAESPLRVTRGGRESRYESPSPELLRLEARIDEQMAAHPNDPYWISLNGRLNLLRWKYDAALDNFKRSLDLRPESTAAATDLAAAYFERAEATGQNADYGTAIELLSKALQKEPRNSAALFNRGLANERMHLYSRAATDWEQLLKVEPDGTWASETRTRLAELKKENRP